MRPATSIPQQENRLETGRRIRKRISENKNRIQKITELKHFKKNQPARIICDVSKE